MLSLMPTGKQQYFNPTSGRPLAGGKLYTYAAGTSTPKPTYQDAAGSIPNTNPITLDSTGSALVFWDGAYKVVLKDSFGNTVYTVDNYNTDPSGLLRIFSSIGSSLIGFVQAGVGAITRTIYAKLFPIIEPEDFGAAGDGVTDDTAAFVKMATEVRKRGGGLIRLAAGKTYYALPTGGSSGNKLIDLQGCRGVTVQGNGATIKTGPVTLAQSCFDLNATFGVLIENMNFESGHQVLADNAGIYWIAASHGAKSTTLRNLSFKFGVSGFVARGALTGDGVDTNRVSGIEAINCHFDSTYYPLNFQAAGDHFFGRGIVTRNCGRSYFPFNVHDHDVVIDSQHGGPFSDVLLKVYGSAAVYSKLENIKLVYTSDGRYPGSGSQSAEEAMVAVDFQLQGAAPGACHFSNIDIQLKVSAGAVDRNNSVFYIRKYDVNGQPDTVTRGHSLRGLKLHGTAHNLQNLLSSTAVNVFSRAGEDWAGESVSGVHLHDLFLDAAPYQDAVAFNCAPITGASKLERVTSAGGLTMLNVGGKEFSVVESVFRNYATRSRIPQSYPVIWTADGSAPNIDAGTLAGNYTVQGKLCTVDIYMKATSGTKFGSGIWHFSLPFAHYGGTQASVGAAMALDANTTFYTGACIVNPGASTMEILLGSPPANFANSVTPFTWGNLDYLRATITYPIE